MEFLLVSFTVSPSFEIQLSVLASVLSWFTSAASFRILISQLNCGVALKMAGVWGLASLWIVVITQTGFVCSDMSFIERHEGDSVVLPCAVDERKPSPYGVYLRRKWLDPRKVLFKHTGSEFVLDNNADKNRTSVSGDPNLHSLNVTISQLRAADTDRYYCEFVVANNAAEDESIEGKTEFLLLVTADAPGSVDMELVETCSGGSAVLPCLPPHGEGSAVEGVSLKRQRARSPVEVLYHSKQHRSSSGSQFSADRVHLSTAPGPSGITYQLTLQQLQPDDSALYSCQLLLRGRSDSSTSLGRRVFFVSVQGDQCGCSSYSSLLYALSSAVVVLLLLLLAAFVVVYKGKARRSVKSHPQAPIYEEMTGIQPLNRKAASHRLEEMESSEYRNCPVTKSCPENHYESPTGGLCPKRES
ncbi:cd7 antigen-like [Acanthochromis polyacanthus]|uniref:cd7 antigen-like n=1 Tax=Acanthochromis polyacanthus TaxID=80966 RepID=UPI000B909835|nr:cd7 antigen-like [Acanthochromis polyacanthus]